jgi:hypothetical protein
MVTMEKGFGELSKMYNELIKKVLIAHGIKCVKFISGDFAKHYEKVEIVDGNMRVYLLGLKQPFDRFGCDFTLDFANILAEIENDLFFAQRNGKPKGGYKVEFTFE